MLFISKSKTDRIRKLDSIFLSNLYSQKRKIYFLWRETKYLLDLNLQYLLNITGVSKEEIESEYYISCYNIYRRYDMSKSSIVPYLSKAIPWEIEKLIKRIKKQNKIDVFPFEENTYYLKEDYYWEPKKLIRETKFLKNFTKSEKFLILTILLADQEELKKVSLAKKIKISRETMFQNLDILKNKFKKEYLECN
jgi:hypothetical protein